eukprot:15325970-Ditylum_brightwellii.AAC.1
MGFFSGKLEKNSKAVRHSNLPYVFSKTPLVAGYPSATPAVGMKVNYFALDLHFLFHDLHNRGHYDDGLDHHVLFCLE